HGWGIEAAPEIGVDLLANAVNVRPDQGRLGVVRVRGLLVGRFRKQTEVDLVFAQPARKAGGALPSGDEQRAALVEGNQQKPLGVEIEEWRGREDSLEPLPVAATIYLA